MEKEQAEKKEAKSAQNEAARLVRLLPRIANRIARRDYGFNALEKTKPAEFSAMEGTRIA